MSINIRKDIIFDIGDCLHLHASLDSLQWTTLTESDTSFPIIRQTIWRQILSIRKKKVKEFDEERRKCGPIQTLLLSTDVK